MVSSRAIAPSSGGLVCRLATSWVCSTNRACSSTCSTYADTSAPAPRVAIFLTHRGSRSTGKNTEPNRSLTAREK
ncbi:Uncharacterised protein [Mycobacteroides abscessus subsp. abscessus]|nr:Uncharacterised protein [Mycobacteroides abscessus subsp. abscessus]